MIEGEFTRENLFPVWDRLDREIRLARSLFRSQGDEGAFRDKLVSLGFYGAAIDIEVEQNRVNHR
jgi:hypothetical protein